ncbi:MAG: GNAT family N-acetyltransferase, partial [Ferruginibacter sp.]
MKWQSEYKPFFLKNIPEIADLNVLPDFRKKGIVTMLISRCEQMVKEHWHAEIGLGVGMTADYGNAQRLYVRLGYLPGGHGLHHKCQQISYNSTVIFGDDLVL